MIECADKQEYRDDIKQQFEYALNNYGDSWSIDVQYDSGTSESEEIPHYQVTTACGRHKREMTYIVTTDEYQEKWVFEGGEDFWMEITEGSVYLYLWASEVMADE